jgi:transcriptional regulator with XRE-family HTH domain
MAAPAKPRRGRPPNPLDPSASHAARLGAKLRALREARGLTLQVLGDLISYTPQYVSEVERAKTPPTQAFFTACDRALDAQGDLLALLPAAMDERDHEREDRTAARRAARDLESLRCEAHSDAGDDVKPTNRRGLIGAAGATALGLSTVAAPAAAREIDPELPEHYATLLRLIGRHDEAHGPRDVLDTVRRELRIIAEHRAAARGELRTALMRVEARWSDLAAWLAGDSSDERGRRAWTDRALRLATESDYADMIAFARARLSAQASDAGRAVAHAEDGLRVPSVSAQTRAWCSRRAALGHALAGNESACRRHLATAYDLLDDDDSPPPPWAGGYRLGRAGTLAAEARCWLRMAPGQAIRLYDDALRDWPRAEARDEGVERARLALACAAVDERDRAEAEGRKALVIARATGSITAKRELKQLGAMLSAN